MIPTFTHNNQTFEAFKKFSETQILTNTRKKGP